ncbi:MAG: outer membrane beta-barrel protein [Marinifilaceae bacterium]|jgi:hypothetical protein|nr:outer membrane beta-barrel protein [Marinifilaceae bacterium]
MTKLSFTFFLSCFAFLSYGQQKLEIKGKIIDYAEKKPLPGATIVLKNTKDTLYIKGTISNEDGLFSIKLKKGNYKLNVSFIGYTPYSNTISLDKKNINIGTVILKEDKKLLNEIKVTELLPPTKQKGDTTIFNPEAFKVNPDADTQELVEKMPGFTVVDNKLLAQGQEVKEVLIDGKKFFGNDVQKALETIPNDIVKNIEVFKYVSKEEKYSGLKNTDEKDAKTLNIVTTQKKKRLIFGRASAGVGKEEKYAGRIKLNSFGEKNRITLTGRANNVNAPLRLKRKGSASRGIDGNDRENQQLGFNYNFFEGDKNIDVSYRMRNADTKTESSNIKTYTSEDLAGQISESNSKNTSADMSHNLDLGFSSKLGKKSYLNLDTRVSKQESESTRNSLNSTTENGEFINSGINTNKSESDDFDISQGLNFSRRFGKMGPRLSLNADLSYRKRTDDGSRLSQTTESDETVKSSIDQITTGEDISKRMYSQISLNHRFKKGYEFSVGYNISIDEQESDKKAFDKDAATGKYSVLNDISSNSFTNTTTDNSARLMFAYSKKTWRLGFSADFKNTNLKNEEVFPQTKKMEKTYFSILPSIRYSYFGKEQKYFYATYSLRTSNPSLSQLQEVVDVSNLLYLKTGNSKLKQGKNHYFSFMASSASKTGKFLSINLSASKSDNLVSQRTIVAKNDTIITIQGKDYNLDKGGQFSQPVNLDGRYTLNANISYGLPLKKLKSKLDLYTSSNYSKSPTYINDKKSNTKSISLSQGLKIESNISHKIDFSLSSRTSYSNSKSATKSEYLSQNTNFSMYWNFWKNFIIRTNAGNTYRNNITTSKEESNWLVDIGISTRVFKNKRGELSFVAYDILNNASEINHHVQDLYTVDYYTKQLNKFFMISFSYKIRNSKGRKSGRGKGRFRNMDPEDYDEMDYGMRGRMMRGMLMR